MLKGGERVGLREGDLEMGEDVGDRSRRGHLGWRTSPGQQRANPALAQLEALPDALQGPITEMAVDGVDRGTDTIDDRASKELPQAAGGQAESSDFAGEPDADRPSATGSRIAIAAKDSPRADRGTLVTGFIESA